MSQVKIFAEHPATVEIRRPDKTVVIVCEEFARQPWDGQTEGMMAAGIEVRSIALEQTFEIDRPDMIRGTSWPGGYPVVVRATEPGDAIASDQFDVPYPLPVEAMIAALRGASVEQNEVVALIDDDGNVMTIMLSTPAGLYLRYSAAWVDLLDPDVIDGYEMVPVTGEAVQVYDDADVVGQMVRIESLTVDDENATTYAPTGSPAEAAANPVPEPGETSIAAAGDVIVIELEDDMIPPIEKPDDIDKAIDYASTHPTARWYVERKITSLGLEVQVPW